MSRKPGRAWLAVLAAASIAGTLSGCGGDDDAAGEPPKTAAKTNEQVRMAFLPGVTANPFYAAEIAEMKKLAASEDVDLTVIDSQLDAEKQVQQLDDLVATGRYDGIVIVPLNGAALVPGVEEAVGADIAIGSVTLPVGPDSTSTEEQVPGMAIYSGRPFSVQGKQAGELAVAACEGIEPCNVAYMFGIKASLYDQAAFKGFKEAIASSPNVKVVAQAEGQYTREGGLKAAQTLLQSDKDLDVLFAVDQSALGAANAIEDAGLTEKIAIVGQGGTKQGADAVRAGNWFGNTPSMPRTEARLAFEGILNAIRSEAETEYVYVDPVIEAGVPDEGRITRENVDQFRPEY